MQGEEVVLGDEGGDCPLDAAEVTLFRATAARANYLALDRPEVAFAAKELCRRMSEPRQRDKVALQRLCRYLLGGRAWSTGTGPCRRDSPFRCTPTPTSPGASIPGGRPAVGVLRGVGTC